MCAFPLLLLHRQIVLMLNDISFLHIECARNKFILRERLHFHLCLLGLRLHLAPIHAQFRRSCRPYTHLLVLRILLHPADRGTGVEHSMRPATLTLRIVDNLPRFGVNGQAEGHAPFLLGRCSCFLRQLLFVGFRVEGDLLTRVCDGGGFREAAASTLRCTSSDNIRDIRSF